MGRTARALTFAETIRAYRQVRSSRDRVLFGVMMLTGARVGEAVQLQIRDAYRDDGTVRSRLEIRPEIAKGGAGGLIPIMEDLRELLEHWRPNLGDVEPDAPLFPSRKRGPAGGRWLDRTAAWRSLAGAFRRAKLEGASPHSLRKAFCHRLVRRGVDLATVRVLMRHSDFRQIQRYLQEVPEEHRKTAISALACPLFSIAPV